MRNSPPGMPTTILQQGIWTVTAILSCFSGAIALKMGYTTLITVLESTGNNSYHVPVAFKILGAGVFITTTLLPEILMVMASWNLRWILAAWRSSSRLPAMINMKSFGRIGAMVL
ncbi:MAG: hypothetical protein H6629_14940 [Calditrichae bacterium]|nr:hypothetical protein [Calditrichia bacterium]